jgi:hypothetical protein
MRSVLIAFVLMSFTGCAKKQAAKPAAAPMAAPADDKKDAESAPDSSSTGAPPPVQSDPCKGDESKGK